MAGSLTQYGEALLLAYATGKALPENNVPTSNGLYAGLVLGTTSVVETGDQPALVELTFANQDRPQLARTSWSSITTTNAASALTYAEPISFPSYVGDGATVKYLALYTAKTGGAAIWYSDIRNGNGIVLQTGDVVIIPANQLVLQLT